MFIYVTWANVGVNPGCILFFTLGPLFYYFYPSILDSAKIQSTLDGKKIIFVSDYSTTGVHRIMKIFSRTLPSPKKYIFSSLSTVLLHGTLKEFNRHSTSTKNKTSFWLQYYYGGKKILATVLLWYKLNLYSIPIEKKYIYFRLRFRLQYYYDAWDLKKSISLDHYRKENIFSFLNTVMLRTWKTLNRRSTPMKNLFLATILDVHGTFEKISSLLYRHWKRIVIATVLLWCTGHRNYGSVLC